MTEGILESEDSITELYTLCQRIRDSLAELANIHLEVDEPTREMDPDEIDWTGRLRKICFHVLAINRWRIGASIEHIMAPEIRAAYHQISIVWKDLPSSMRLDKPDVDWWAKEARSGILVTYDHPTAQTLMLSARHGGFSTGESGLVYAQLALWLGYLVLGYGLALLYLPQVLGNEADIEPRVTAVLQRLPPLPTREVGIREDYITDESEWEALYHDEGKC